MNVDNETKAELLELIKKLFPDQVAEVAAYVEQKKRETESESV